MLNSSLCDYSDPYILVSATIIVSNTASAAAADSNNRKNILMENSAPFTDCISEINNTQIDNGQEIEILMPMHNLIEYSDNYSKTYESLWQYYKDEPFLDDNGAIANFSADNTNSALFICKTKIASKIEKGNAKNVKIRILLKSLSNFWRAFEMSLINCEIHSILTWSARCFIIDDPIAGREPTFTITDTKLKLYVPVVTLSTQDNGKLLQQLKSGCKRTIKWNKYQPKLTVQEQNQYLDFLIGPRFQGVNRLFVLSFENNGGRTSYTRCYFPLVEIKN